MGYECGFRVIKSKNAHSAYDAFVMNALKERHDTSEFEGDRRRINQYVDLNDNNDAIGEYLINLCSDGTYLESLIKEFLVNDRKVYDYEWEIDASTFTKIKDALVRYVVRHAPRQVDLAYGIKKPKESEEDDEDEMHLVKLNGLFVYVDSDYTKLERVYHDEYDGRDNLFMLDNERVDEYNALLSTLDAIMDYRFKSGEYLYFYVSF